MESSLRSAQLGKYSLVAEIARGGMGIVYLAQAIGRHGFKKLVVVKQLKPELGEDEKFREMFLDEARLAARLNHRNIVQTIEVDQEEDRFYFVMEYLEGRTLHAASLLKGDRAFPVTTILWILCDVLAGLHYAHELADFDGKPLGVVHRDVSPRNVFLTYDGQVKLLDFGVAKAAGRGQETEAGELKGRIPYMSPEHVREKDIDRRADVFSVGVLLREVLTKRRLWDGSNEVEILSKLLAKEIPPIPPDIEMPDEVRGILEKAMAPDRDERYRTAHEMRSALEHYVSRIDKTGAAAKFGEPMSKAFAEHRAQLKELIEQHVAHAESMPPAGSLPALAELLAPQPGASVASSSRVRAAAPKAAPSSDPSSHSSPSSPSNPSYGSHPSHGSHPSGSVAPARAASGAPALYSSNAPEPTVTKDLSIPPPPPKSRVGMYVAIGMGFVAVVAALTVVLRSMDDDPATNKLHDDSPPVPTQTERRRSNVPPPPSASAEPADLVEVTVRASPPVARIWVDEVSVGEGPHTQKFKRDSRHVVRATAPGYVPRTETITVNAMMSVNLVLEKEAGAPPAPRSGTGARPHATPTPPSPGPSVAPDAPPPTSPAPSTKPSDGTRPYEL